MPPTDNSWSHRPPPPLPSYPLAAPVADVPETGRWFLVSLAGRASMRIRERFVVGSGSSCDLSLVEWGIAPKHALLAVENGALYISPLADAPTLVDGQVLRGRVRLHPHSALSFGELEFGVQFEAPEPPRWASPRPDSIEVTFPPLEPVAAGRTQSPAAALASPRSESRPRPRSRNANAAPIALGMAVPLVLFALWFFGADQWPAQLAQDDVPLATAPVTESPASELASNAHVARDTAPVAAETASVAADTAPSVAPDSEPVAEDAAPVVADTAPVVATPASNDAMPQSDDTAPVNDAPPIGSMSSNDTAPMSDATVASDATPPVSDATVDATPREAALPASDAGPLPLAESSSQPAQSASDAAVVATPPTDFAEMEAAPAPKESPADTAAAAPLILATPESPPLVDVGALAASDRRVKPPWSDEPPLVAQAQATVISPERAADAVIPPPSEPLVAAAQSALAERDAVGPPLIFKEKPPLVDITALSSADSRVKPPKSDVPPLVARAPVVSPKAMAKAAMPPVPAGLPASVRSASSVKLIGPPLIYKEPTPLVDLKALAMADARVKPPWSDISPTLAAAANGATDARALAALMAEAGRLYSQGDLVTPPRQNAAELYMRVLRIDPKSRIARTRLNNIVGWIARDASDALAERRPETARQIVAQLSTAVPKEPRGNVDAAAMRRWRVVELLLAADALMQKRQIVGPRQPNAVSLLREVLKIDRHNAIAEQMLGKALGLVASAPDH